MKTRKLDEYYQFTAMRLKNYPYLKARLQAAINYRRDLIERTMEKPCAPIPGYGERTSRTSEMLTQPEAYSENALRCQNDLWKANRAIVQMERLLQQIEGALCSLEHEELRVICLRYWGVKIYKDAQGGEEGRNKGLRWVDFERYGWSERNAQYICCRAQWKIRNVLFPCRQDDGTGIVAVE